MLLEIFFSWVIILLLTHAPATILMSIVNYSFSFWREYVVIPTLRKDGSFTSLSAGYLLNHKKHRTEDKERRISLEFVCLLVGCLTSQQHASVSQGRVCSDNCTCCHTEIGVGDQTFHLTQSQYTDPHVPPPPLHTHARTQTPGQPVPALTL